MRIRSIKPEFFKDEDLAELTPLARLLFQGLWCMADREGRLEDRPRRIKAEILPYDECDIEALLGSLSKAGFINRYSKGSVKCIQIKSFLRHQIPNRDEAQSELPSPEGIVGEYIKPPNATVRMRIYQRDRFTCVYCGLDMTDKSRARCLDLVVPLSQGGSHRDQNTVTACKKCAAKKADLTPIMAGLKWPAGYGESKRDRLPNVNPPSDPPLTGGLTVSDNMEQEREQEQEGNRKKDFCPNGNKPIEMEPPSELATVMPLLKRVRLENPGTLYRVWSQAYPDVDIGEEIMKCDAWGESNRVTRSPKGWARTLNTWLKREQDKKQGGNFYERNRTGGSLSPKLLGAHRGDDSTHGSDVYEAITKKVNVMQELFNGPRDLGERD